MRRVANCHLEAGTCRELENEATSLEITVLRAVAVSYQREAVPIANLDA